MFATQIAGTAYRFVIENFKALLKIGAPFIALLTALFIIQDFTGYLQGFPGSLITVVIDTAFAFFWHRHFLLGRDEEDWWRGGPKVSTAEKSAAFRQSFKDFFRWTLQLWFGLFLGILVLTFLAAFSLDSESTDIAFALVIGVFLLASPLIVRVLPYFPAIAVGRDDMSVDDAFKLSRGHTLHVWLAFVLTCVPLYVIILTVSWLTLDIYISLGPALFGLDFVLATLSIAVLALGVSANSEIFRRLSGWEPPVVEESGP